MIGVVVVALAAAACGDTKVESTHDGRITVVGKGAKAAPTITDSHGGQLTFNQRHLPVDLPEAVPRPEGLALAGAASGDPGGRAHFELAYRVPATTTAAGAAAAYRDQLTRAGFTITDVTTGADALLTAANADWQVTVAGLAARTGAPSTLLVTVQAA